MCVFFSQTAASDSSVVQHRLVEECEHSCVLKEDLGYVCRICGVIEKSIDTIFDFQWIKVIICPFDETVLAFSRSIFYFLFLFSPFFDVDDAVAQLVGALCFNHGYRF